MVVFFVFFSPTSETESRRAESVYLFFSAPSGPICRLFHSGVAAEPGPYPNTRDAVCVIVPFSPHGTVEIFPKSVENEGKERKTNTALCYGVLPFPLLVKGWRPCDCLRGVSFTARAIADRDPVLLRR